MVRFQLLCSVIFLLHCAAASDNKFDEGGRLQQIALGKGWMTANTDVKIPLKGWTKILSLGASKPAVSHVNGVHTWKGTPTEDKAGFAIEQIVREVDGKLVFDVRATAQSEVETEGVYFWIEVPTETFAGGTFRAGTQQGALPQELPAEYHLCSAITPSVALKTPAGAELVAEMQPGASTLIQDDRKWSKHFSVLIQLAFGKFIQGQSVSMQITLSTSGNADEAPAKITLDAATPLYKLDGIGGNYCFNIESPVTRYTLDNLHVAFARTEMSLEQWEPENDDGDAAKVNWSALVGHDALYTRLHGELELMKELSAKKIPYIASIWKLPGWLYTKPPDQKNENNRIDEAKWPEVVECIVSYLQYAKEKYQVEPAYFSFNESNCGVRVLFTGEEHRDLIKRLGAAMQKAGLKTRMLLGDVGDPRETIGFTTPTANDPEALKYVGALSFHSWGGATPEQYIAWGDLAAKLKLPLIVAEAGVDPAAWQGGLYQNFDYGAREMSHYLDLFRYARPQAVLLWEFTGDYSLLTTNKFNKNRMVLTERFCFQKHWCDLTLPGSDALKIASDNAGVQCAAFKNVADGKTSYTIHLGNPKWSRKATLEGLPADIKTLNVVRTARGEMFKKLETVTVTDGKVSLDLPGLSLTTLTTLEIPVLKGE
jgi:O-glycosyl hydrolase